MEHFKTFFLQEPYINLKKIFKHMNKIKTWHTLLSFGFSRIFDIKNIDNAV